jgi:hypothetical protein
MRTVEYVLSVVLALLVLTGVIAWTQVSTPPVTELACRSGHATPAVFVKGMSVYPRCPGGRRGLS